MPSQYLKSFGERGCEYGHILLSIGNDNDVVKEENQVLREVICENQHKDRVGDSVLPKLKMWADKLRKMSSMLLMIKKVKMNTYIQLDHKQFQAT